MPISNPCTWFAGGGSAEHEKSFVYEEGGTKLWHFSPYMNGMSSTLEMNIVWFADTRKQALQRLREMCVFRLDCAKKQEVYQGYNEFKGARHHAEEIIKRIDENRLKISPAPMNQFYIVGWASNDTL